MIDAVSVKDAPASLADASFAEITARRRGRLRRYLFLHPGAMDAVVVLCYLILVTPTAVESVLDGAWPAPVLLAAAAVALFLRRSHPVAAAAVVAAVEVDVTLLHAWRSNVAAGLWFSLYAVAVVRPRRFAIITLAAATASGARVLPAGGGPAGRPAAGHRGEHAGELPAHRQRRGRHQHHAVQRDCYRHRHLGPAAAGARARDRGLGRAVRAAEVLGELSSTGRTALAYVRRVLGVLRGDSAGYAPANPGGRRQLGQAAWGFRTAGLPLHYTHTGPSLPDGAAFQLTVYRIVQESLTNVLRYGRALGRVEVDILRDGGTVVIDARSAPERVCVRRPGRPDSAGDGNAWGEGRGSFHAEIAHRYFLSDATVKTHVRRILTKLHLRDRGHAVVYAHETGLVVPGNPDY